MDNFFTMPYCYRVLFMSSMYWLTVLSVAFSLGVLAQCDSDCKFTISSSKHKLSRATEVN